MIKAILADALGLHLDQFQRIVVDPASISVVTYTETRPFVVRVNDTGGDVSGAHPAAAASAAAGRPPPTPSSAGAPARPPDLACDVGVVGRPSAARVT